MKALLIGVNVNNDLEFDYSIEELENLIKALDIQKVELIKQNVKSINEKYYLGKGKLEEIKAYLQMVECDVVIFDNELTVSQQRNLEDFLELPIYDRPYLILKIFELRAKTYEARLQVEIASLKYQLPRLKNEKQDLMQQKSGSGFANKGSGEKKLELDKRQIHSRINFLEREVEKVKKVRNTQRRHRLRNEIPKVALVGYTNAGKSSLMNTLLSLTNKSEDKYVFQKDLLFATLDTNSRLIKLKNNHKFLLCDTVGFINHLPTDLIKAFRSTLEEALDADLILLVSDISNPNNDLHVQVTLDTLAKIGATSIPLVYVFNKQDLLEEERISTRFDSIIISCKTNYGIDKLLEIIEDNIFPKEREIYLHIPYSKASVYSYILENFKVDIRLEDEDGYLILVHLDEVNYNRYKEYEIKENEND